MIDPGPDFPAYSGQDVDTVAPAGPLQAAPILAQRLLRGRRASLMLPADGEEGLRIVAASGLPDAIVADTKVRLGDPVAGLVAQTRQSRVSSDPRPIRPDVGYRTGAFVSVPVLLTRGRAGVLSVADPLVGQTFGQRDLAALQNFAGYVALAVDDVSLKQELIRVREDERRRVARELHDEAGHALTAAVFRLDLDALRLAEDPGTARVAIERARMALQESVGALHDIAYALRPRILDDLGLPAALRSLVARTEQGGLQVILAINGDTGQLNEALELAVFRVAQEALTNVRRHAHATQALVTLAIHRAQLALTIEDNGIGVESASRPSTAAGSLGLLGMRERVEAFGGRFEIGPRAGGGTRVLAVMPLPPE